MDKAKSDKFINLVIFFFSLISFSFLLYLRFKFSLTRYFDVDEFAHLHWGYSFLNGAMPYRDFFYIFPPYFLFPISFIISIFGRSAETLIAVRGFIFLVQLLTYLTLFIWARKLRGLSVALLTLIIFIFLPLPSDKLLEIRPDLISTMLAMAALLVFVKAYEKKKILFYFLCGFLFSASLLIVPKTIFFLLPVAVVVLYQFFRLKSDQARLFWKNQLFFALGLAINFIICGIIFMASGNFFRALYFISKLASDVTNALASRFYMRPDIFFYPNDTFYGSPGVSQTLIVNLTIYFLGIVWGIKNFVSSLSYGDDKKNVREFIFSASLMVNLYAFVKVFPLKHLQYLIPVSLFVAFYFADMLAALTDKITEALRNQKTAAGGVKVIIYFIFIGYLSVLSYSMYAYKSPWVNTPTINNLKNLLEKVPANEPILDLTGETVFYPDGYYFCCLPYGQYEEALNFKYPDFETDLKRRGTKYVHIGITDRLGVLPALHAKYIRENFSNDTKTADPKIVELNLMIRRQ